MPQTFRRFCSLFLLAPLLVWAAEPWKDKSSAQWTKKDVDRILFNSPWAKSVATPTTWARVGGEHFGIGGTGIRIGIGDGNNTGPTSAGDPLDPQNHSGFFIVRWASSHTMRAAQERDAQFRAKLAAPKAAPAAESFYEIEIDWDLFAEFPLASEDEAAQNSYLQPSLLGVEFKPQRVEYRRGAANAVRTVVFYFEKRTKDGAPLVSDKEKRIEFGWRVGPSAIRARFDPQKMLARAGKDY